MKNIIYGLWLFSYLLLSYFFFVERDFATSFYIWLGLIACVGLIKSQREPWKLLILIGACFTVLKALHFYSPFTMWPMDFYLVALFGYLLLRFGFRKTPEKLKWSFVFSKREWASIFIINVPAVAILLWYFQLHPHVAEEFPELNVPTWGLPLVVLVMAALNGLREEIFFRGLIQPESTSKNAPMWFVIALQAVLFGFLHYAFSFPEGWVGVLMTAVWGAAISFQYRLFKSISLAWVTHTMADAIMFGIILCVRS
ncbi:CPBP family intramembrane glutamic endopeptidase [Bdellovibrio sp. HCB185ZH]|uniref:CPBP family intramembrane glutamic endopeptidase n=1 Tax=Bdellovibrio sp. HCB185ZH TaxID=3394235 RepID=UPI0039A55530